MKITDIITENTQGVAEGMDQIIKITFTPDDIEVVERAAGVMPTAKILPNIIDQYEKIAGIDREGDATLTLDLSVDDVSAIALLVEKYGRRFDQTGIFHHIIDELERQGVAEEGYGNHPSQRVDPRTGKKYVPPKSPLGQGVAEGSLDEGAVGIITAFAIAGGLLLGGGVAYKDHNLAQQWMQSYEKIKQSDPEQADKIKYLVNQYRFTNFRNRATRDLTKKQIEQIITNFDAENTRQD